MNSVTPIRILSPSLSCLKLEFKPEFEGEENTIQFIAVSQFIHSFVHPPNHIEEERLQALIWVKGDKANQASMAAKGFTLGSGVTRHIPDAMHG